MTVQLLANEDSLLDIQADIDGPGAMPPPTAHLFGGVHRHCFANARL
jgi:hypothetical protein